MLTLPEIGLGVLGGYVLVTLCESIFHRLIQHAPTSLRRHYRHWGWLGRQLEGAWFSHHIVHHHRTFTEDHVTQFRDAEQHAAVDRFLYRRQRPDVIRKAYGARIGGQVRDYLMYVAPTSLPFVILCLIGGPWFTLGAFLPFLLWPLLAEYLHPYLHRRDAEIREEAPALIRWLCFSSYGRRLRIHHWLHHEYGDCNYNLLLGGDMMLRINRRPNAADLEEMRRIGLMGD